MKEYDKSIKLFEDVLNLRYLYEFSCCLIILIGKN